MKIVTRGLACAILLALPQAVSATTWMNGDFSGGTTAEAGCNTGIPTGYTLTDSLASGGCTTPPNSLAGVTATGGGDYQMSISTGSYLPRSIGLEQSTTITSDMPTLSFDASLSQRADSNAASGSFVDQMFVYLYDNVANVNYNLFYMNASDAGVFTTGIVLAPDTPGTVTSNPAGDPYQYSFSIDLTQFVDITDVTLRWSFISRDDGLITDFSLGNIEWSGDGTPSPTPVPLPASAFLLLAGFGALRLIRRRT